MSLQAKGSVMKSISPLDCLIDDFPPCLEYFVANNLHSRFEQYLETMRLRKEFDSVSKAISSDEFLVRMRDTLSGFFRLARAVLLPSPAFEKQIREHRSEITALEKLSLSSSEGAATRPRLWDLMQGLKLTEGQARLVSGSKALHLLLPELMLPVDRAYTGAFLLRFSGEFDNRKEEEEIFRVAFQCFRRITEKTNPAQYVNTHEFHTSPTKVIDNAITGFVDRGRAQLGATDTGRT